MNLTDARKALQNVLEAFTITTRRHKHFKFEEQEKSHRTIPHIVPRNATTKDAFRTYQLLFRNLKDETKICHPRFIVGNETAGGSGDLAKKVSAQDAFFFIRHITHTRRDAVLEANTWLYCVSALTYLTNIKKRKQNK